MACPMPKIAYIEKRFSPDREAVIVQANEIIGEYAAAGYDLTLRQLFYQFVARDIIPNSDREYKRLGAIVNDARMAGLIDWKHIVDRTRNVRRNPHWDSPQDIIQGCADQFQYDKWADQPYRVECFIEKDALVGVISGVCEELDIPYFSCRGYTSQSEMWAASRRMKRYIENDQVPCILHLGDHDPSGIDMTRDIVDRLEVFMGGADVRRLALNFDQVEEYSPPPNPAKVTDSRSSGYIERYGSESWELDALEPQVISRLIREAVEEVRDDDLWRDAEERGKEARRQLQAVADKWDSIQSDLDS